MKKSMMVAMLLVLATFTAEARQKSTERFRVLISTDIGGTDPDDNQSMAVYVSIYELLSHAVPKLSVIVVLLVVFFCIQKLKNSFFFWG